MSADAPVAVSVVVLTHNEGTLLTDTVAAVLATTGSETEVVVVDDGSTDGSADHITDARVRIITADHPLGISAGRNLGARSSTGSIVVFSDAHVEPQPGWLEPLVDVLDDDSVGAVAPTVGHLNRQPGRGHGYTWRDPMLRMKWLTAPDREPLEVPFLCGCFVAMRREVFDLVGGFDEGMYKWGSEDSELSLRLWLQGYRCLAVPRSEILHLFRKEFPYSIDHSGVLYNALRQATLHFSDEGLGRFAQCHAGRPSFAAAWARLLASDSMQRRRDLDTMRTREAAWFGQRFELDVVA